MLLITLWELERGEVVEERGSGAKEREKRGRVEERGEGRGRRGIVEGRREERGEGKKRGERRGEGGVWERGEGRGEGSINERATDLLHTCLLQTCTRSTIN